ncbi:MAG: hypothetical protein AB7M93_09105 [Candidatus Obscuribacterales bacterium]
MTTKKFRSCFITAPFGTNLHVVEAVLHDHGISIRKPSIKPVALTQLEVLSKAIRSADFMIAILEGNKDASNLLFEIGLAAGMKKPVLLVVDPKTEMPSNLRSFHYLKAKSDDRQALAFHLEIFLKHSKAELSKPKELEKKKRDVNPLNRSLESLRQTIGASPTQFQETLMSLLTEQRIEYDLSQRPDDYYDFAIWLDDIEPTVSNPVLVELKTHLPSDTLNLEARLQESLKKSGSEIGIVAFLNSASSTIPGTSATLPLIVYMHAESLLELLYKGTLASHLLQCRNLTVHG